MRHYRAEPTDICAIRNGGRPFPPIRDELFRFSRPVFERAPIVDRLAFPSILPPGYEVMGKEVNCSGSCLKDRLRSIWWKYRGGRRGYTLVWSHDDAGRTGVSRKAHRSPARRGTAQRSDQGSRNAWLTRGRRTLRSPCEAVAFALVAYEGTPDRRLAHAPSALWPCQ